MDEIAAYVSRIMRAHAAAVDEAIMRSVTAAFREGMCAELHISEHRGLDVSGDRVTKIHRCSGTAHHQGEHTYPTLRPLD
jgi:hypothetical protein